MSNRQYLVGGGNVGQAVRKQLSHRIDELTQQIKIQKNIGADHEKQLRHRIAGLHNQIRQLIRQKSTQADKVHTLKSQMPNYRHLLAQGYLTKVNYQKHYNAYLGARANLESLNSRIASTTSDLSEAQDALEAAPNKLADQISQLRSQRSSLEQQRATSEGKRRRVLRAPVAGRVTAVQVHSGQEVDSKRPLMAILPQGAKYVAELFVPSRAIGFVHKGQHVELQYDAFPHERFGVYNGTIVAVADAIMTPAEVSAPVKLKQSVYRVRVALDHQTVNAYGKATPLTAGMTLSADIILEKRTLLDWILDPIYSFKGHL